MRVRQSQAWHTEGEGLNLCRWDSCARHPTHDLHWAETDQERWNNLHKANGAAPGRGREGPSGSLAPALSIWPPVGQGLVHVVGERKAPPHPHHRDRQAPSLPFSPSLCTHRDAMISLIVDNHLCVWEKGRWPPQAFVVNPHKGSGPR